MLLHLNGEKREFPDGLTVASLVERLGMKPDRVAVELNLEIVPRANWQAIALKDGDKLEVVHFVGGGSASASGQQASAVEGDTPAPLTSPVGWTCPTCGHLAASGFCADCGERKPSKSDFSLRHFFSHALGEFFHFDSKIFRTCRLLFTKPGFLTAEYVRGCRKPYLHPFQVFFIANLVYFLVQPYVGWTGLRTTLQVQMNMMPYSNLASRLVAERIAAQGVTLDQFARSFDHVVDVQARSLVVLMIPLFALVLAVLEWRKRLLFGRHLVFSLHFTAFWLVTLLVGIYGGSFWIAKSLARFGIHSLLFRSDTFLALIALPVLILYTFLALRTVYRDSIFLSLVKSAVLSVSLHYVLDIYRFILFFTALYSA